jgi:putative ABC transport system ATP-binding protein
MLNITHLNKSYRAAHGSMSILECVELHIGEGESASIQGPSGCGKSTLLHLVGALDKADSGSIVFSASDGKSVDVHSLSETEADLYRRQHIGFVFQKFNLIDCISVFDNISLPAKLNQNFDKSYINILINTLDIAQHCHKLPNELSGGEQQRVAIARALAHRPQLVLADEPTGNLDERNSDKVCELLYRSCKELSTSLLIVTHSAKVAHLADRQLYMHNKHLTQEAPVA